MSGKGSIRKEENSLIDTLLAETRATGVEVFFSHFRINTAPKCGYATMALAVQYVPEFVDKDGHKDPNPSKDWLHSNIVHAGWCFCSPKDTFRASRGRLGAVRRLISHQQRRLTTCEWAIFPKKEIKFLAEKLLKQVLIDAPPPWYSFQHIDFAAETPVKRLCLCGPKRAKQLVDPHDRR